MNHKWLVLLNNFRGGLLEDARRRAEHAQIKPGPEVLLALAVLMMPQVATGFQVTRFWGA